MRIATNVNALNAWRNLSGTNNSLAKTLEKLSSGYRINRAADDAAGLAISEKMRGQIAGLNMAVKNAQDGISLIQTGEGALNEVHAILTRMEELAVQAASDTNTAEDRAKMQAEMDQLAQEITRIGSTTEFNTLKLLDGTFASRDIVFHVGANEDQNLRIRIDDMRSYSLGLAGDVTAADRSVTIDPAGASIDLDPDGDSNNATPPADGTYDITFNAASSSWEMVIGAQTYTSSDGQVFAGSDGTNDIEIDLGVALPQDLTSASITIASGLITAASYTGTEHFTNNGLEAGVYKVESDGGSGFNLVDQNGETVDTSTDGITWSAFTTGGAALAAGDEVAVGGIDISSGQTSANAALPEIRDALELVSSQRSLFGATQNRLEHTINNLQVAAENLSAAESRIRDVDMAAEMANFTRNQILLQAGTAMLAQANAAPQSVLQLLG